MPARPGAPHGAQARSVPRSAPPAVLRFWWVAGALSLLLAFATWGLWSRLHATGGPAPPATQGASNSAVGVAAAASADTAGAFAPVASLAELRQQHALSDWRVRRLRGAEAILVIEFPNLDTQGETLNRVAAFLEKARGRRDRVLNDEELRALIRSSRDTSATFYLGHDYRSDGLARFFTLAGRQGIGLNRAEQRLLQLLIDVGMLQPSGTGALAAQGDGALVSYSAVQPRSGGKGGVAVDATRRLSILSHELSHGRYYTDATYRQHCAFFWRDVLTSEERGVWKKYLASQDYNTADEDLMINETQALLMHTPDRRDFSAQLLNWSDVDLDALRQRFRLGLSD